MEADQLQAEDKKLEVGQYKMQQQQMHRIVPALQIHRIADKTTGIRQFVRQLTGTVAELQAVRRMVGDHLVGWVWVAGVLLVEPDWPRQVWSVWMGGVEVEVGKLLFQGAEKAEHHEHMWQVSNTDLAPRIVKLANH